MNVTEQEFFACLDAALDYIKAGALDAIPHSSVDRLSAIVAWAYDSTGSTAGTLDGLRMLDAELREIALAIIVGAVYHHRPPTTYRGRDEIERLYFARVRNQPRRDPAEHNRSAGVPISSALHSAIKAIEQAADRANTDARGEAKIDSLPALVDAVRQSGLHAVVGPRELVSALLIRIALDLAIEQQVRVTFASASTPAPAVALLLLAADVGMRAGDLRSRAVADPEWIDTVNATSRVTNAPLSVLARAKVPRLMAASRCEAGVVVVDDLLGIVPSDRIAAEVEDLALATVGGSAMVVGIAAPPRATLGDVGVPASAFEVLVRISQQGGRCCAAVERSGMPAGSIEFHYDAERDLVSTVGGVAPASRTQ